MIIMGGGILEEKEIIRKDKLARTIERISSSSSFTPPPYSSLFHKHFRFVYQIFFELFFQQ